MNPGGKNPDLQPKKNPEKGLGPEILRPDKEDIVNLAELDSLDSQNIKAYFDSLSHLSAQFR